MEKDHLPIKKVVKMYEINRRLKPSTRVPIAVSSCPAGGHMYRYTLRNQKYPTIASFTVCLNVTFTDNRQVLRT